MAARAAGLFGRRRELVNQVGLEPTKAFANGLRGRSLCRSGHWSVVNADGYDPLAHGLKVRSLSIRVLRLGVPELVQAGGVEPPATRLSAEALAVRTRLPQRQSIAVMAFPQPARRPGHRGRWLSVERFLTRPRCQLGHP